MEIRIGIRDVAREVTLESSSTPEQVRASIAEALSSDAPLVELEDDKGGTVLIPTTALGYVEIGSPEKGRVGFGSTHCPGRAARVAGPSQRTSLPAPATPGLALAQRRRCD